MENLIEVNITDLDEIAIKGKNLVINNLSLAENDDRSEMPEDHALVFLELSCSAKNKSDRQRQVSLMVIGYDQNKKPLWAIHLSPLGLSPNRTESMTSHGLIVPKGTKDRTATLWLAAYGDL